MMNNQKTLERIIGISNLFGLEKQGTGLLSLVSEILECPASFLVFLDATGESFSVLACEPAEKIDCLSWLSPGVHDSVIKRIDGKNKFFTRRDKETARLLKAIGEERRDKTAAGNIEVIVPLVSSDRPVGMLLVESRNSGEYAPADIISAAEVVSSLAPSLEKEYIRESSIEREKELTVLNHCSTIVSSSLDIAAVYAQFINELKNLVDIDWSVLTLLDNEVLCILAVYSDVSVGWQTGELIPSKGTATEWVVASRMPLVESDLKKESLFNSGLYHREQKIRSITCVPLLVNEEEAIGSLIIGSEGPDAYNRRQVEVLRELAVQIAKPVQNAQLYTDVLKQSRYDDLTGLFNRRSLDEQIVSEIDRHSRYGGVFSLVILDLDHMKPINDRYGHLAGDGLLSRTGKIITGAIRSVDQAFRYGGDEFAILLPNTPGEDAKKVSERVRKQIASQLGVDDMNVTASFGLASWPENGMDENQVVAAADAALYKAKHLGGNRSCYAGD
jgi:diguanylate cyclase (GGDEF)-like protein